MFNGANGLPIIVCIFFIIPILWVSGIIRIGSRPGPLLIWTLFFGLFYGVLIASSNTTGGYQLTVQFLNADERPMSGKLVTYKRSALNQWLGISHDLPERELSADSEGRIHVQANHHHSITLIAHSDSRDDPSLKIDTRDMRFPHDITIQNANVSVLLPHGAVYENSEFKVPVNGDISLVVKSYGK